MTKVLFFLVILFIGICWTEASDASEPWEGKAITVLNVRRSPGIDSQAIGWLNKGQKTIINDEKQEWYQIIFKVEGKRYREGWVHSRYIQRISSGKVEVSSALAEVRAGIAVEELQEEIPLEASAGKGHLLNGLEKELNKATPSVAIHVAKEQARAASQTKPPASRAEAGTIPPRAITPVVNKRVDSLARTIGPVIQKSLKQEPPVSHDRRGLIDTQELKELGKLALRLLSVLVSCLAILFSYKAIRLAKMSHLTAMQLQRELQVWQQRENG